jgi:hypothetical protein
LRVLLKQRENDREEIEEKVLSNVKDAKVLAHVDILESNLKSHLTHYR